MNNLQKAINDYNTYAMLPLSTVENLANAIIAAAREPQHGNDRNTAYGWAEVVATMDEVSPGWNLSPDATDGRASTAACRIIREVVAERDELLAWKQSQMQVESEWDIQLVAKQLGGTLGQSCRKVIAERVPMIIAKCDALTARVAELEAKQTEGCVMKCTNQGRECSSQRGNRCGASPSIAGPHGDHPCPYAMTSTPTPRTDQAVFSYYDNWQLRSVSVVMVSVAQNLGLELAAVTAERDEWKAALTSIHPTDRGTPAEMAGDIMDGAKALREALKFAAEERDALLEYKADIENATKGAMDERCGVNERHCSCVPLLRSEVKRLTAELDLWRGRAEERTGICKELLKERDAAAAERDALRRLVMACGSVSTDIAMPAEWDDAYQEARAIVDSENAKGL